MKERAGPCAREGRSSRMERVGASWPRRAAVVSEEQEKARAELWAMLAAVRDKDLEDAEVERIAGLFVERRDVGLPILLEQFRDPGEDATLLAIASVALKGWEAPYPTRPLIELLRLPEVGALAKALIMNVLERYGIDVDRPDISGVSINLEDYPIDRGMGTGGKVLQG